MGTSSHRFDRSIGRTSRRDKDHRDSRVNLANVPQHIKTRLIWETQVKENNVWQLCAEAAESLLARIGHLNLIRLGGE